MARPTLAVTADVASGARRADGLHHRLLGADGLDDRVCPKAVGELLDHGHTVVAAFGDDVGSAEIAREGLPRLVTAHRDDAIGAQLLGGEDGEQADRTVTDDGDRLAGTRLRGNGAEPAGAQHVRGGEQAWHQLIGGKRGGCRKGSIGEGDAQQFGLCAVGFDQLPVEATGLVADAADHTCVVRGEERADNEFSRFEGGDVTADLLDDAAVRLLPR